MTAIAGFFHAGVTVSSLDASLRFYRDALGLDIEFKRTLESDYLRTVLDLDFQKIDVAYLRIPGGGFIELLEYIGIERLSAAARPCDPGGGHLCLYVDDIDAIVARMKEFGYRGRSDVVDIVEGPNKGARSIYLQDPDKYSVELVQPAPNRAKGQP